MKNEGITNLYPLLLGVNKKGENLYIAITHSEREDFKTLSAAKKWLHGRGYAIDGSRISNP